MVCHSTQVLPFVEKPTIIKLQYEKNGKIYQHKLILPMLAIKFIEYVKPIEIKGKEDLPLIREYIFRYSRKMLPKPGYLGTYF